MGRAKQIQRHFVSLPTEEAHTCHPVGQAASFCQRIHPIILQKISELVSSGIVETKEVQKALNHYVKHTLPTSQVNIISPPIQQTGHFTHFQQT